VAARPAYAQSFTVVKEDGGLMLSDGRLIAKLDLDRALAAYG